jgi:L-threonylcarbamoyladenylate synthase
MMGQSERSTVIYSRQAGSSLMSSAVVVSPDVDVAVAKLAAGGVIAFPTDTLYALAADATNDGAVARVFDIKGREGGKPLPLFVAGLEMAEAIAEVTDLGRCLAARFWPGALTIVWRRHPEFRSEALAGGATVALRAPDHPFALEVVRRLGRPVTATSANLSGGPDPVTAADVVAQIGDRVDLVIDGGPCAAAVPSTIVDCSTAVPTILREGAIGRDVLEPLLGLDGR